MPEFDDDGFADVLHERPAEPQPPEPHSAWNQVAIRLRDLQVTLEDGKALAASHVLAPSRRTMEAAVMAAWSEAFTTLGEAVGKVDDLLVAMARTAPPVTEPYLQVVLAEIVAEGHRVVRLIHYSAPPAWGCQSSTGAQATPAMDTPPEEWDAWRVAVESGEADAANPLAAAEARLAQIRELRAQRAVTGEEAQRVASASEEGSDG